MIAFDFQPRTRVVFGPGCVVRTGQIAKNLGFQRSLVVGDPGIREAGHTARVLDGLTAENIEAFLFDTFGVNPDSEMVDRGAAFARTLHVDSIVAIGGGSSLDCAKGINFVLRNGGKIADYRGYGKASTPLLPMIGIPTTAGTGSEAQSYAVIADARTRTKMACGDRSAAFRVAILDPDLTVTAPRHVAAMAGYDAIAHAVETAATSKRTPLSDMFSHHAWTLLSESFERVLLDPGNADARSAMMLGAHFAGMAIEQSMLGAAHACANPLTTRHDVAHGLALAIVLPHVVRWNAPAARDRYAALLGAPRRRMRDDDPAETLARQLEDFAVAGRLSTRLSEAGVNADAIPELAQLAADQWTGTFNPRPFDAKGAEEIYRAAF